MADRIWAEALRRKRAELDEVQVGLILDVATTDSFHASLDRIAEKYSDKGISKLSAAQTGSYGGAVWGGLLVMIESTCRFSRSLDDILAEIQGFYEALPNFLEYIDLYENDVSLQYCLRDLFEDYLDYCICVVKFVKKNPVFHIIRNLGSSSQVKGLGRIKSSIAKHTARFKEKAELAHRRNVERNNKEMAQLRQTVSEQLTSLHIRGSQLSNVSQSVPAQPPPYRQHASASSAHRGGVSFVHTVNLNQNTIFTGRKDELEKLQQYLNAPATRSRPVSCAIHGIGGVGKTQLALEYSYRYRSAYQAIFWLRAENSIEVVRTFASIGNEIGLTDDANQGRRMSKILNWLENTERRWLLIMDNVEELDTVSAVWPNCSASASAIIVTTQKPCDSLNWTDTNIALHPLTAIAGSNLLLRQLPLDSLEESVDERTELAQEISDTVGGLPLWLNALGGFIAQSRCTLSECLECCKSSLNPLDYGMKAGNWAYEGLPSAVFDLALSKLSEDARTLLYLLAFLSPDGVPETVLAIEDPHGDLNVLDRNHRQRFISAVANLRGSQLVEREGRKPDYYLTTHRSIQKAILHKLDRDLTQRQISFDSTCAILRQVFPRPSRLQQPESDKWPLIQTFLPQLLSLEKAFLQAEPPIEGSLDLAILFSDVGLNVWDRGMGEDAWGLLLTSEKVLDGALDDEWAMERSDIHVLLGILTDMVGITQRREGLRYRESAKRIRAHYIDSIPADQLTLEEEIRYYNTVTDLACSHQQFDRYDEIEATCKTVIEKYRSWGTEEEFPYEYAKYYHHMAYVYVHSGDTARAVDFASHATELLETGSFGLLATVFKFDCATIFFQHGDTGRAIQDHKDVLERRLLKLGPSNIMTVQSNIMLGAIYYRDGQLGNAETHMREALMQCRKRNVYRETHIRAKFYMSLILGESTEASRVAEARQLADEARRGLEELLPLDRPGFLATVSSPDDPILYDYLAPWTHRIHVAQKKRAGKRPD